MKCSIDGWKPHCKCAMLKDLSLWTIKWELTRRREGGGSETPRFFLLNLSINIHFFLRAQIRWKKSHHFMYSRKIIFFCIWCGSRSVHAAGFFHIPIQRRMIWMNVCECKCLCILRLLQSRYQLDGELYFASFRFVSAVSVATAAVCLCCPSLYVVRLIDEIELHIYRRYVQVWKHRASSNRINWKVDLQLFKRNLLLWSLFGN